MGRTGRRRELGNKQKRKKRQDRASFHFEFVFYRVSFSSSLSSRGGEDLLSACHSPFPLQYIFFFSLDLTDPKPPQIHTASLAGEGRGGEILQTLSLSFFPSSPPRPYTTATKAPDSISPRPQTAANRFRKCEGGEGGGGGEEGGIGCLLLLLFFPSLQPCMFYVLQ